MNLAELKVDKTWTLFLDRDGVINEKLDNDYVKSLDEFRFLDGAIEAIKVFTELFGRILIVTNQQGIGKGLMTHEDLKIVHNYMSREVAEAGGKLDAIYYCPELASANAACRKPNTGMIEQAKHDFTEINFMNSIMVGDSISDIEMGKRGGAKTVYISSDLSNPANADFVFKSLVELKDYLLKNN